MARLGDGGGAQGNDDTTRSTQVPDDDMAEEKGIDEDVAQKARHDRHKRQRRSGEDPCSILVVFGTHHRILTELHT